MPIQRVVITITCLLLLGGCSHGAIQQSTESPAPEHEPVAWIDLDIQPEASAGANEWAGERTIDTTPVVEHDDLWIRIRTGMTLEREIDRPAVREKLIWYSKHQAYLDRVAERATPYLYHIVEEIEARDLPLELALLPIVESAYQPLAYSRSHAAGIWQFIPATGRRFGLKQNWWYDGRRDITASTRAALDYLELLHDEFNGNWQHAVAAYNAGENTVRRAIARNRAAGRSTAFWHLGLPRETRGYVPALLAIAEIVAQPERYGIVLQPIPNEPYFTRVATGGQIDLDKAARLAGIDHEEMKRLNPAFKRWATDPDGPHHLLLPLDRADQFARAIEELPEGQRLTWRQHRIRRGETLGQIARRYGTTVAVLQRANQIRGHLIRAGRHLLIPAPGAESIPENAIAERQQTDNSSRKADALMHTVNRGDSLWTIARRYGTTVNHLTVANNINSGTVLRPGQRLKVPAGTDNTENGNRVIRYTVRPGDSLWAISRRFQVSVARLREWNSLNRQALLQPGQELQVRLDNRQPHGI